MKPSKLQQTATWKKLQDLSLKIQKTDLNQLFQLDPERFQHFSFTALDHQVLVDLSKQQINQEVLDALLSLTDECHLEEKREALFNGEKINTTENRAALHTALRSSNPDTPHFDEIQDTQKQFLQFAEGVRGNPNITDIVNIGIGGSDLGTRLATQALQPYITAEKCFHFISNIDPQEISEVLAKITPEKTLFIITSKSFTTLETLENTLTAKKWFMANGGKEIDAHFVAVTTNIAAAKQFGIETTFPIWDWAGGRYSIWSAVGLSLAIAIGKERFKSFLHGAEQMDEHFKTAPSAQSLPTLLALIDIWNRNFLNRSSRCIAPYYHGLRGFPAYLQQLEMESNGKSTNRDGERLAYHTAGAVWGEAGSNGQHAFFQLFHQGTEIIPIDFILVKKPSYKRVENNETIQQNLQHQHRTLLLNALAQSRALMIGKSYEQCLQELNKTDTTTSHIQSLARHKTHEGNRPSTTILLNKLDPFILGALIALHEHRTFVAGTIWGINSFDQWGVELGKGISKELEQYSPSDLTQNNLDDSTSALYSELLK